MWDYIYINILVWTPVLCMDEVSKDLLTPIAEYGEACGYQACPETIPTYLNVHIVPATHAELGGTRTFFQNYAGTEALFQDLEISMKGIYDGVITDLWSESKRTFTLTDLPYFFHWWKNRDATVRRMVYQLIRQGRLFFAGGGWGMSDEAAAHYHSIIDHYTYGLRKLNATFLRCARPLVTWQADTFGHSREFASLMAQMGFDGHFINPISFDDELSRMRSKSLEFVWRGSDDLGPESDIFTHKLFDGYWSPPGFCFGTYCNDQPIVTSDNIGERVKEFGQLMQVRQGPYYTTNNVMVVMGQRFGYHDSKKWFANIDQLIRLVNDAKPKAGLRLRLAYSTPACYLKEVQKAQPVLRTKQDDFFPLAYDKETYATGMFYSRPSIKYIARELHLLLFIAKQLQMLAYLPNNDKLFEDIQWMAGAILDHTILTGGMQSFVTKYYLEKAHKAKQMTMMIIKPAFNKLRDASPKTSYHNCPFNESTCWTTSSNKFYIVVYNPLAWPVTLPIRVPVQRKKINLFDNNGAPVNHSIVSVPDFVKSIPVRSQPSHQPALEDELVFIGENIPPMGYRSYYAEINNTRNARPKRSILKKLPKNNKRKYITGPTSKADGNLVHEYDDDYIDENITNGPIIEFGNVSKGNHDPLEDYDYVLTPKSKTLTTSKPTRASFIKQEFELPPFNYSSPFSLPSRRLFPSRTITETPQNINDDFAHRLFPLRTDLLEYFNTQKPSIKTKPPTTLTTSTTPNTILEGSTIYTETENESTKNADIVETTHNTETKNKTTNTDTETDKDIYEKYKQLLKFNVKNITIHTTTENSTIKTVNISNTETKTTIVTEPPDYEDYLRNMTSDTDDEGSPDEVTWEEEIALRRLEKSGYHSVDSSDDFIRNDYIKIKVDRNLNKVTSIMLSNGLLIHIDINMYYYVSDDPQRMGTEKKRPGAYFFRPMDPNPELITKNPLLNIIKSSLLEEIQIKLAPYAAVSLSLYKDLPYIELDWVVGPIPIADTLGKEVFIRYSTDLENNGVFYTDSNGRQTIKRIKNMRSTYTPILVDQISSNFYPVVSKVYIEDIEQNIRFSVFPDRSEGCTSLSQGELDIMLHRRILTDDTGISGIINETAFGKGLVVRGKHRLYISRADYKPNKVFEKKFAKELELQPKVFTSAHPYHDANMNFGNWSLCKNQYSALKRKLPIGIHILSFEKWNRQLLIRLENYLEIKDVVRQGSKSVKLLGLFKDYVITRCTETMLGTHIWKSDYIKMQWQRDKFVKNFNDVYGNSSNLQFTDDNLKGYEKVDLTVGIELDPQQIRTFVCDYKLPNQMS